MSDCSADCQTYTVKPGDTLWGISNKIYGKGSEYTRIHEANIEKIPDPNKIYPGMVLKIPQ